MGWVRGQPAAASPRGGEHFQTFPEGGGSRNFRLGQFLSMFLKHNCSCFVGNLGTFNFFGQIGRGGKYFRHFVKGGVKNIRRITRGGERFWIAHFGFLRGQFVFSVKSRQK